MTITNIQMLCFVQSLVSKIKSPDMELTRTAPAFRNNYKKIRGLPRNANALAVLRDVKVVCTENDMLHEFDTATKRYPEILAQLA